MMNKLGIAVLGVVFGLAATGAFAKGMSKAEYKAEKVQIRADYKSNKDACKSLADNARDVCVTEAKAKEKAAKAELKNKYEPTKRHRRGANKSGAKGRYAVAKEKCEALSGDEKTTCINRAKARYNRS